MPSAQDNSPQPVSTAQVLRRFRVVFNTVRGHFQQVEKQAGVGGAQVWALSVIRDQPGIGMGGLAKSMDIHQSTASNLVKALQKKDMLSMTKAAVDRRNVEMRIMPAGLAVLAKVTGPFEGVLPEALGQLPPETLARMDGDLLELIRLLKADEKAGGIPLGQL
jgi:DNA-binding MarR family transcriptional regulator